MAEEKKDTVETLQALVGKVKGLTKEEKERLKGATLDTFARMDFNNTLATLKHLQNKQGKLSFTM